MACAQEEFFQQASAIDAPAESLGPRLARTQIFFGSVFILLDGKMAHIHHEWQLMHKLVLSRPSIGRCRSEATQLIYHDPTHVRTDPYIAVYQPQNVSSCFPVRTTHIPNFRIRAEVLHASSRAGKIGIFIFHKDLGVKVGKVREQALQDSESGVVARRDAEVNGQAGRRVGLAKGRGEAFVKVGL